MAATERELIEGGLGTFGASSDGEVVEYRKVATVRARRMTKAFTVNTVEGMMNGEAGDYLCEGPGGECWPIRREIFEATYEVIRG